MTTDSTYPSLVPSPRFDRARGVRLPAFDPRLYQIGSLSLLLIYGMSHLGFDVRLPQAAITIVTALTTQWICSQFWRLPLFDPKSAMISALSLCLLFRSRSITLVVLVTIITIASKFVLRWRGKHIFNPTNFGIVVMMILFDGVWVSPGQWGNVAFFAFLIACAGGLVVNRAARSDVTYAFAFFYAALLIGRSLYLHEPLTIPFHRLESGALLLFTFFMISDPRTTPSSRPGRILFAALVATGAAYIQLRLFRTNGLLWSLVLFSMSVPLIDWLLPGHKYEWSPLRRPLSRSLSHSVNTTKFIKEMS
ncbi:MAG TPA: RnfABCDGE type electron transport complex subunit D [Thermoanaerobaculia bacterium]|nr:RnfABCDGE type electron transport complex subunit D [Thermoanaerobaculia bacterium]